MSRHPAVWQDVPSHIRTVRPERPVLYFSPTRLNAAAGRFLKGFPGLVTYAVKANDTPAVIENLLAAGITAFDVASPHEIGLVRSLSRDAALHYNNPVRSKSELRLATRAGVVSYAIDDLGELEKLAGIVPTDGVELSVRLKLPVKGGYIDFGSKFGATPNECERLLRRVAELGFRPSMTFHPGTQCEDPQAWVAYIAAAARVAERAGVRLCRLNVGGGFPGHRTGAAPDLGMIFETVRSAADRAFRGQAPALVCEPGRALVSDAFLLATRVKSRRGGAVYLNDGVYGLLSEAGLIGSVDRIRVLSPDGEPREGPAFEAVAFGPTCDSLDRIKGMVSLPDTIAEGDYIIFDGMGAYSTANATRFNGYGSFDFVTLDNAG